MAVNFVHDQSNPTPIHQEEIAGVLIVGEKTLTTVQALL